MDCSTPVYRQLPEFTQTHVHRVSDAIQPSHPLSLPSPPAHNPSQHQSLFQWVNSLHEVAKVELTIMIFQDILIAQMWAVHMHYRHHSLGNMKVKMNEHV